MTEMAMKLELRIVMVVQKLFVMVNKMAIEILMVMVNLLVDKY